MRYGTALREEIGCSEVTPLVGIFDMYSASIAAQYFEGMFVSGFGFAASYYGLPDIGFIAWPDMVGFVQRLRLAFPDRRLLVDIDDGYADVEIACHVVEQLQMLGASGVILEDQQRPRRCGHVAGKQISCVRGMTAVDASSCGRLAQVPDRSHSSVRPVHRMNRWGTWPWRCYQPTERPCSQVPGDD
ncbi:isocitrate lyase/phosphoenolpyruvate mutase family protein [Nocardia sp. NPDC004860]|uniref:isocitrate lyase/phosphoenolpyruvate mutase family protein n=1 Tax=Nocardia sp. NPDC004860 TaxID=3154557 RepID=UPI0033B15D8B